MFLDDPQPAKRSLTFSHFQAAPVFVLWGDASAAEYVIAISVDGLRPSAISQLGPEELPNFYRFRTEGIWTDQARTDYDDTYTDPNHEAMVTGRRSKWFNGLSNVSSMFNVAHDHGLRTAFYSSKGKLRTIDISYSNHRGFEDLVGEDNGLDKIDHYEEISDLVSGELIELFVEHMGTIPYHLSFVHIADTDWAGHGDGWESEGYSEAVRRVDEYLGRIFTLLDEAPFAGKTTVLLTADHGGEGHGHSDAADPKNYTIPFYAWGADVPVSGDFYQANVGTRLHPGTGRPTYEEPGQPIRNGDLGNLTLSVLGLPPIPGLGAIINQQQDLRLTDSSVEPPPRLSQLRISEGEEDLLLEWDSAGPQFHYQVETSPSLDSVSWEPAVGTSPTAALEWDVSETSGSRYYRVRLIPVEGE